MMKNSRLKMPFSDFEETLMMRIEKEKADGKILSRDRRLSFTFFILGTLLGLMLNFILEQSKFSFPGISKEACLLLFQCIFILLFLTQVQSFIGQGNFFSKRLLGFLKIQK